MLGNARIYNASESVRPLSHFTTTSVLTAMGSQIVYEDADHLQRTFDGLYDKIFRRSGIPGLSR